MRSDKLVSFENTFFETENELRDENPDAVAKISIDGYPADENRAGRTVCELFITKHGDIVTAWRERRYKDDIAELVEASKAELRRALNKDRGFENTVGFILQPQTGIHNQEPVFEAVFPADTSVKDALLAISARAATSHYTVTLFNSLNEQFLHYDNLIGVPMNAIATSCLHETVANGKVFHATMTQHTDLSEWQIRFIRR